MTDPTLPTREAFDHLPEPADAVVAALAEEATTIRRGLAGRRRRAGTENVSGEAQMAADVWADELLVDRFSKLEDVGAISSVERDEVVQAGEGVTLLMDPLDGSSNLRSNNSLGTILAVADATAPVTGSDLLASAYVLYGPLTTMVVTDGDRVTEHVVEEEGVRQVRDDIALPEPPTVFGVGGRVPAWTSAVQALVEELEEDLKLRYGGAMVGDVNQVLTYGGLFAYPMLTTHPRGKLRHQFEALPLAFILEAAGGSGSDGERALLEAPAGDLHGRTPVFLGNRELVARVEELVAELG